MRDVLRGLSFLERQAVAESERNPLRKLKLDSLCLKNPGMYTAFLSFLIILCFFFFSLLLFLLALCCLGWIMKATCCLLKCDSEFMFAIAGLGMLCLYYENAHSYI